MARERTATGPAEDIRNDIPEDVRRLMTERTPSPGERATAPVLGTRAHTELFQYWQSLPRENGIPDASDFNPMATRQWLPEIAMLSLTGPEEITQRLVGTGVAERLGFDATGTNLLDLVDPSYRRQCARDMHEVGYRPCGWQVRYLTHYPSGRLAHVQSIYLPLRGPAGQPPRILSLHDRGEATGYRDPAQKPNFASEITKMVWIDIGFGVPD